MSSHSCMSQLHAAGPLGADIRPLSGVADHTEDGNLRRRSKVSLPLNWANTTRARAARNS
jgi:hypothetical protein